ncbi:uncharacterized protein LOC112571052 [Pomacea canaliculata]|uniref:uncharacterized protein LOC112571052 n=1 Tax=Pomacea canaliculata TaxID=400727 RepID=UPI000D729B7A|nr:uncharacterized protein LOC112571052 [Pomacea canaliculata]
MTGSKILSKYTHNSIQRDVDGAELQCKRMTNRSSSSDVDCVHDKTWRVHSAPGYNYENTSDVVTLLCRHTSPVTVTCNAYRIIICVVGFRAAHRPGGSSDTFSMDVRNILVLLVLLDAVYSRPALVGHPYQDVSVVLEGLDFDNDGIISSGEMYQYYKSLDINNDGTVTYEEFAKSSDQNDNQQMFAYFDVLDGRRDNRISRRKIAAALQQLYDLNYDGSITTSEIDIVRKRKRPYWKVY